MLAVRSHLKFEYLCENELLRKTILTCLLVAQIILKLKKSQKSRDTATLTYVYRTNIFYYLLPLHKKARKPKNANEDENWAKKGKKKTIK